MLMMNCAHIGEVQSSVWDHDTVSVCEEAGVRLL
jgi:aspartate--ammonia ligase